MKYCKPAREFEPLVKHLGPYDTLCRLAEQLGVSNGALIYKLRAGVGSNKDDSPEAVTLWRFARDYGFFRNDLSFQLTVGRFLDDEHRWLDVGLYDEWYEEVLPHSRELFDEIVALFRKRLSPAQAEILEFWAMYGDDYGPDYQWADSERRLLEVAIKNTKRFLLDYIVGIIFSGDEEEDAE